MTSRARLQLYALRALLAALVLWAAPAHPVHAAVLVDVPVLMTPSRVVTAPRASQTAPTRAAVEPPRFARVSPSSAPVLPTFASASPRYVLNCALLR